MKCTECGVALTDGAKFCSGCGSPQLLQDAGIDSEAALLRYALQMQELLISYPTDDQSEDLEQLRKQLKVSFFSRERIENFIADQIDAAKPLSDFTLEFDEEMIDAYAGHDAYLKFRFTNLSQSQKYRVFLKWSDPETSAPVFCAQSPALIRKGDVAEFGASHVFLRAGPKDICGLAITVENIFGSIGTFVANPFQVRIGSIEQRSVKNVTNQTSINIEGRGVVDASGIGGDLSCSQAMSFGHSRWKRLEWRLEIDEISMREMLGNTRLAFFESQVSDLARPVNAACVAASLSTACNGEPSSMALAHAQLDGLTPARSGGVDLTGGKEGDQEYLSRLASEGDAEAQYQLGCMHMTGVGANTNIIKAVKWLQKAAGQGHADAHVKLASIYLGKQ